MILILILISVFLLFSLVILYFRVKRVNKLEELLEKTLAVFDEISDKIEQSKAVLDNDRIRIAFENDDEIGTVFKNLRSIQNELSKFTLE